MVIIGATVSRLAIRTPISEISSVKKRARFGSPSFEVTENTWRNGITLSLAIACKSLGALNSITRQEIIYENNINYEIY